MHEYYYSRQWQVLEARTTEDVSWDPDAGTAVEPLVASSVAEQNLWDVRYVDAPAVRWCNLNPGQDSDFSDPNEELYFAQDANFNVTALVNGSGAVLERYEYDAYGAVRFLDASFNLKLDGGNPKTKSDYNNPYLYTARRLDEDTGLYHYRHRDYDPYLARFTARDKLGYSAGDMNLYAYVGGRPVIAVDPAGLEERICTVGCHPRPNDDFQLNPPTGLQLTPPQPCVPDEGAVPLSPELIAFLEAHPYTPAPGPLTKSFTVSAKAQKLFDRYNLGKGWRTDVDDNVRGIILDSLIMERGDAEKAFGLVYELRNAKGFPDNDEWASVDHFYNIWTGKNNSPIPDGFGGGTGVAMVGTILNYSYCGLKLVGVHVAQDNPNNPPSPVTVRQWRWGQSGCDAALWFPTDMRVTSPKWKEFLCWLDEQP